MLVFPAGRQEQGERGTGWGDVCLYHVLQNIDTYALPLTFWAITIVTFLGRMLALALL